MSDNPLDFLDESDAQEEKPPKKSRRRSGRRSFNTGLETVSPRAAAKATGSKSMAGQYKRYTVYLAPEVIVHFKELAEDFGVSQAEMGRWFFDYMIEQVEEHELRPETVPVEVRRRIKR